MSSLCAAHPGSLFMTARDQVPNADIVPRKTLPASTIYGEEPPPPPLPTKSMYICVGLVRSYNVT